MSTINSTCDVSTIFGGNGPPIAGAYVFIGNKQLIPSPFVNLVLEKYKVGDKTVGGVLKVTLNGMAIASSFSGVIDGEKHGTGIKDILRLGQLKGCVCVIIKCESELINGYGRIISVSANEGNQPTWVNMAPYTIELEVYDNAALEDSRPVIPDDEEEKEEDEDSDYVLKNISETLSWSINEDTFNWGAPCVYPEDIDGFGNRHIKVNFNLSVTGVGSSDSSGECLCEQSEGGTEPPPSSGTYGLAAAEKYLRKRLKDLRTRGSKSLFDMSSYSDPPELEIIPAFEKYTGGASYLDFRNIEIDPQQNTINLSGEITYRPSGCANPDVFTSLTVEHSVTTEGETVTINGNIIGLVDYSFDRIIHMTATGYDPLGCEFNEKINSAELFLQKINSPNILQDIASCYSKTEPFPKGYIEDDCEYSAGSGICEITPTAATPPPVELCEMRIINSQITRNFSAGEINFSFTLSNAPNCEIAGASRVDVNITHDRPHDSIVEFIIPGRGSRGPLIQNLCCNSSEKYDISIDASLNRKTCNFDIKKETIEQLRRCAEKQLEKLVEEDGIDIRCWFKVNDTENIGNATYKLNRSYVKPSCP
jgi:hypothetical protein